LPWSEAGRLSKSPGLQNISPAYGFLLNDLNVLNGA
jgi:hypothetical protein